VGFVKGLVMIFQNYIAVRRERELTPSEFGSLMHTLRELQDFMV
jgi:hypothetical protein